MPHKATASESTWLGHRESPESRKKSNRKYRITSYGLTLANLDLLLEIQGYAFGMCREPLKARPP
jgi:hypothetical protein